MILFTPPLSFLFAIAATPPLFAREGAMPPPYAVMPIFADYKKYAPLRRCADGAAFYALYFDAILRRCCYYAAADYMLLLTLFFIRR